MSVLLAPYSTFFNFVQDLHKIVPAFTPYVPVGILSYLAFILLTATFGLAFYFTTCVIEVPLFHHESHHICPTASQNQRSLCVSRQWLL
jgi:hypothetical protein